MNDVIVVTGCTERKGLIDTYQSQLSRVGVDHVFESLPYATSSFNMEKRISYWRSIATRFINYRMVIITDAWDVLFFGDKQDLLAKSQTVLISAERNCFPGPEFGYEDLTDVIKGTTPWRYSNPGMVAANPRYLLEWLRKAERTKDLAISDQAWCNRRLVDGMCPIPLDEFTNLFYVISYSDGRLEDGVLQAKNGRPWNSKCDTYPNFFHFAGHGPGEARRVLPESGNTRYSTMNVLRACL